MPLAGLARFAWVKTSDAARRRPYSHCSSLIAQNVLVSNPFGVICVICGSKNLGRCTQTSLPSHFSLLTAHYSLLKNLSYLCHLCAIVYICQKIRKGDLGVRCENAGTFNLLIINRMQIRKITSENKRKKDLSVSWVSLKSFCGNT